jgi:hypothetical protein
VGTDAILEELRYIEELLDDCYAKMEELLGFKPHRILWNLFFPAGQFMQRTSIAKAIAGTLITIDSRLHDMVKTLEEFSNPLSTTLSQLLDVNLVEIGNQLVELPERAQYMIHEIETFKKRVEDITNQVSANS